MKYVKTLLGISLAILLSSIVNAQCAMCMSGAGSSVASGGGCSYTGPGNVDANWDAWWGLRAFSAATCGQALANVCTASDAACGDISSNASTGVLVPSFSGNDCTMVTCTVKVVYDQTGNGYTLSQTDEMYRPVLVFDAGKPAMQTSGAFHGLFGASSTTTIAQPFTMVLLVNEIAGAGYPFGGVTNDFGNAAFIQHGGTYFNGNAGAYLTSNATVATATWHSVAFVANGASNSNMQHESVTSIGDGGTGAIGRRYALGALNYGGGGNFDGYIREAGVNTTALAGLVTTLTSNMSAGY